MKYNQLGSTDLKVSEVSLGTWAIGNEWGYVDEKAALDSINYAIDRGVNFFDTADIYGAERSEILLGKVLKERSEEVLIATKFGRKDNFADLSNYTYDKVKEYCELSLQRLGKEAIDLYQIHCPSTEVLEALKKEGKIRYYGISVETDTQGKYVLENTNTSSLQIIVNILRQKPVDEMIKLAHEKM